MHYDTRIQILEEVFIYEENNEDNKGNFLIWNYNVNSQTFASDIGMQTQ